MSDHCDMCGARCWLHPKRDERGKLWLCCSLCEPVPVRGSADYVRAMRMQYELE